MTAIDDALDLARSHGLELAAHGATRSEAGLDYRVVMADDAEGRRWVLRLPRRDDVADGIPAEARILDLVGPALADAGVAVPDWRIRERDLVAYPALPGAPGLTLSPAGEPVWHMDPQSPDYAARLGRLLARLHAIDVDAAAGAGVEVRTAEEVRAAWRDYVSRVEDGFAVAPALVDAWRAWLDDDACWPVRTVMTHGEIYPAHVLLADDGAFTGVLDWTTARVDDPARDLAAQFGAGGEAALAAAIEAYGEAGGDAHPGLARQAQRLWEASPIGYGLYALTTGAPADREAAQAVLDPRG
ncbi:macrolide 2'-phosphotransferase [Agrococcus sp. SL85]|uniref:macrolide 2'-phosphotransferase n=1 Tax=Agrococcus sp. SL85 TaxID=2995141 RepID=UPI00226C881E|nr:macrolide 2'-phosphotransferase [Agrococcus sp. SL85]WAC67285.1 macrolide 2'-phosphotransferase [Agrococcus sp. SL85]